MSIFDDLIADPAQQYREMLDFMGLPNDFQQDFRRKRETQGFKVEWLQRILKRPPRAAVSVFGSEQYRLRVGKENGGSGGGLGARVLSARKSLLRWNKAPAAPVKVSREVEEQMREMFADEVALLETLLDRRLAHLLGRQAMETA